jgi:hypothetical protein
MMQLQNFLWHGVWRDEALTGVAPDVIAHRPQVHEETLPHAPTRA